MNYIDRIEELTAEWEEGANYGESEKVHYAADYALSEDDWALYLGVEAAAEIMALIQRREADRALVDKHPDLHSHPARNRSGRLTVTPLAE